MKPAVNKPKGPSKFAAFRAQMKQQQQQQQNQEESAAVINTNLLAPPMQEEAKTFDAGFFKVKSPLKNPAYHCEGKSKNI